MKSQKRASLTYPRRDAFTLIELLVVIIIIAIVAGIATPVSLAVMNRARKAQCKQQISGVIMAIEGYEVKYGHIPIRMNLAQSKPFTVDYAGTTNGVNFQKSFMQCLIGQNPGHFINPRETTFLEPKITETQRGGLDASNHAYYDPWGRHFVFMLDGDFDNSIVPDAMMEVGSTDPVTRKFLMMSYGKDLADPSDNIYSWK